MSKEELSKNLLGMADLQKRWKYESIQGVRMRRKHDKDFPTPIAKLNNNRFLVFWLPDIEEYEKLRDGIDSKRGYTFYQTKDEWDKKSREEREKQRGFKYSDEEWLETISDIEKAHVTYR